MIATPSDYLKEARGNVVIFLGGPRRFGPWVKAGRGCARLRRVWRRSIGAMLRCGAGGILAKRCRPICSRMVGFFPVNLPSGGGTPLLKLLPYIMQYLRGQILRRRELGNKVPLLELILQ